MARPLPEWIGKTDAHRAPEKVRLRVFDRSGGICHLCDLPITDRKWDLDHEKALINGGENRESNLKPAHRKCHKAKTAADVAEKAKVAAIRAAHLGARTAPARPMQGQPFPKTGKTQHREAKARDQLPMPERRPMFARVER